MQSAPVYLIAALGNPGSQYQYHRHNVGFMVGEELRRRHGLPSLRSRFKGLAGEGTIAGQRVALLLPMTFMNLSGTSVGEAVRWYKTPVEQLLVIHDEVELPFGDVRLKEGGGLGGHNGLRSIEQSLGSRDFWRLRVGVGRPASVSPASGRPRAGTVQRTSGRGAAPHRRGRRSRRGVAGLPGRGLMPRLVDLLRGLPAFEEAVAAATGGSAEVAAPSFVHAYLSAALLERRPWSRSCGPARRSRPGCGRGAGARADALLSGPSGRVPASARRVVRVGGRGEAAGGRSPGSGAVGAGASRRGGGRHEDGRRAGGRS